MKDLIGFAHLSAVVPVEQKSVRLQWPHDGEVLETGVSLGHLPFIKPDRK
ncbi:MAG: hypothetical protein J4G11_06785 [Acidimicrobiia bacterium]|nr:hypothetical protein [Acidimicrobiia bacterium]